MGIEERTTSWWVGRGVWVAGALAAAIGGWYLLKEPAIWAVLLGVAAMGAGNYIRHHKLLG